MNERRPIPKPMLRHLDLKDDECWEEVNYLAYSSDWFLLLQGSPLGNPTLFGCFEVPVDMGKPLGFTEDGDCLYAFRIGRA